MDINIDNIIFSKNETTLKNPIPKNYKATSDILEKFKDKFPYYNTYKNDSRFTKAREIFPQLTDSEIVAVLGYTGKYYDSVNRTLRWDLPSEERPIEWLTTMVLVSALNKLPTYEGTVYRVGNISPERLLEFKNALISGETMVEKTFLSTSANSDYTWPTAWEVRNTRFHIKVSSGTQIAGLSVYPTENEVLLQPYRQFKVIKIEHPIDESLETNIYLEEVLYN